jgi:D-3-phosphoglycerate dehydrogenase
MPKVLITTVPFCDRNRLPLELLDAAKIDYVINPIGRKLKEPELAELISDFDVVIAGTEPITDMVMSKAKNLKLISRVGVGLDNVDLIAAKKRGISVSFTPDAPAPAVAACARRHGNPADSAPDPHSA